MSSFQLNQEDIFPAARVPWSAGMWAYAGENLSQWDIVLPTGATGPHPTVSKADADAAGSQAGVLWIATGQATSGERLIVVPWVILTDVDTSAASADGDPVYLSTTAGGWTATKPSGADDVAVVIGQVLNDDTAANGGSVMLAPAQMVSTGFDKVGTAQASAGSATVTVSLGAAFADALAVATLREKSGSSASTHVLSADVDGSGDLTITFDAAPGGSETSTAAYFVRSATA